MRALALLVLLTAAWAQPLAADHDDLAEPRLVYGDRDLPRDPIGWRKLERADFQGEEPPPHLASHAAQIGAVSCVSVELARDTRPLLSLTVLPTGERRYTARFERPRFAARFDRLCSWWNPLGGIPEYLLQHEQVHFDLTELAARALTRELARNDSGLRARAASEQEALSKLEAVLSIAVRRSLRSSVERQAHFDQETSRVKDAERQAWWARQVARELDQSALAAP